MITTVQPSYPELEACLQQEDWRLADAITFEIMLEATERQRQGWLDHSVISAFPCTVLHRLDQHWLHYSSGHFGFSTQLHLYTQTFHRSAFDFSCHAGWTLSRWQPLGFFKFYPWLTFSLDAPRGHLPARWFWEMPWYRSWLMGAFGSGRGGGFGEAGLFDALMLRLERCQQI